jgi:mono/diheme cytochrome c family protein
MRDFLAAHGDEPYAALSSDIVQTAHSFTLRNYVNIEQPLLFDGLKILRERWPRGDETEPLRSQTWDDAFQAFERGDQLALPYFAPRVSDPFKAQQLTAAYQRFRERGEALPDLADIFPDDPQTRAEIGLQVAPDATPARALVQACGSCHNDVLDQSLSRARFSVALARLDRSELDAAIARLRLPASSRSLMPPKEARQLDTRQRAELIDYLERDERSPEDDAFLEHAAQSGMTQASEAHL